MARAREQMKMIETELERVRREIGKLQVEEALLLKMQARMNGEPEAPTPSVRVRSANVKPVVLDIMSEVGSRGGSTIEVEELVRLRVPTVANGTVGSVLARLKSEGALVYVGDRYFEKRFAPKAEVRSFEHIRAVS